MVNKTDLLSDPGDVDEVVAFVKENATAVAQCERSRGASRELEERSQGEEGGFVKLRQLARVRRKRLRKV